MQHLIVMALLLILIVGNMYAARTAHFLNNLFNLPHPGPNDIQGACSCREHEGPNKHTMADYLKHLGS